MCPQLRAFSPLESEQNKKSELLFFDSSQSLSISQLRVIVLRPQKSELKMTYINIEFGLGPSKNAIQIFFCSESMHGINFTCLLGMQWNVMDEVEVIADSFLEEHKKYTYSVELVQAFIESICNADSS